MYLYINIKIEDCNILNKIIIILLLFYIKINIIILLILFKIFKFYLIETCSDIE